MQDIFLTKMMAVRSLLNFRQSVIVIIRTQEIFFPPNKLYITIKLSPEVAILHVYSNGADEYALWGGNAVAMLSQTEPKKAECRVSKHDKPGNASILVGGSRLPYGNTMEVYVQLISREDLGNNPIH
ncbi:MAG: hypothetical protein RID53_12335 [Coleofasciculus sp. B1-GNL1-01]|uniref:hypothetical protein n=1 Tax=Coleofasciculus sp. B1-GNL1-01 TaxID=3068484 RepID=UPI0033018F46